MKISPLGYSGGNFTSVTLPGIAITVNAQSVAKAAGSFSSFLMIEPLGHK
jgi:hypothetical protein